MTTACYRKNPRSVSQCHNEFAYLIVRSPFITVCIWFSMLPKMLRIHSAFVDGVVIYSTHIYAFHYSHFGGWDTRLNEWKIEIARLVARHTGKPIVVRISIEIANKPEKSGCKWTGAHHTISVRACRAHMHICVACMLHAGPSTSASAFEGRYIFGTIYLYGNLCMQSVLVGLRTWNAWMRLGCERLYAQHEWNAFKSYRVCKSA